VAPLNPRHARLLAQTAFEEAAELARDARISEAIDRALDGLETLLINPCEDSPE